MGRGAQRLLELQGLLWQLPDKVHLSKSIQHVTLTVSPEEDCTLAGRVSVLAPQLSQLSHTHTMQNVSDRGT